MQIVNAATKVTPTISWTRMSFPESKIRQTR
jgi:hypothetical protein